MLLLLDIGNTHTGAALGSRTRVSREISFPTSEWKRGTRQRLLEFVGSRKIEGSALCSVVPQITPLALRELKLLSPSPPLELTPETVTGIGIDYPRPETIGADRLANAIAAKHHFGAPVVVVDFGTAVTFDVVDKRGNYAGGIIAPGLAAMTDYLHEKTALLPRIRIRDTKAVIGKNTEQAMLAGAVHGYRGMIRELIGKLRTELKVRKLPVIATGGYGSLIARNFPPIHHVEPRLTFEGLRLAWLEQASDAG